MIKNIVFDMGKVLTDYVADEVAAVLLKMKRSAARCALVCLSPRNGFCWIWA